MSNGVQIPGTNTPKWITIAQIISITLLLIALIVAAAYLLKLVFIYMILPIGIIVIKSFMEILKILQKQSAITIKKKEDN